MGWVGLKVIIRHTRYLTLQVNWDGQMDRRKKIEMITYLIQAGCTLPKNVIKLALARNNIVKPQTKPQLKLSKWATQNLEPIESPEKASFQNFLQQIMIWKHLLP